MKKLLIIAMAGVLFVFSAGCEKPVDKGDQPVDEIEIEEPPL